MNLMNTNMWGLATTATTTTTTTTVRDLGVSNHHPSAIKLTTWRHFKNVWAQSMQNWQKKCYKVRLYVDRTWQSPRKRQLKYWKLKFYSQPWRIFPYKSTASQLICNLGLLTNTSQQHIVNTYCIWNHKCLMLSSLFIFRVSKIKFYLFGNLYLNKIWNERSSRIFYPRVFTVESGRRESKLHTYVHAREEI